MPPKRKAPANPANARGPKRPARETRLPARLADDLPERQVPRASPASVESDIPPADFVAAPTEHQEAVAERFQEIDATLLNMDATQQDTVRTLAEIMESLQTIRTELNTLRTTGTTPTPLPPADVLSRWSWVEQTTIQNIVGGQFDIYDLPKLHQKEPLRSRHNMKAIEGYMFPVSGGKPSTVTATSKFYRAFKDLKTFLAAWNVYASIRSSYAPERAAALFMWTERLIDLEDAGYEFTAILDYIRAYFQEHQNSPANQWFRGDSEIYLRYLGNAAQRAVSANRQAPSSKPTVKSSPQNTSSITGQICHQFNRSTGCRLKDTTGKECLRRHVCQNCLSSDHAAYACKK